MEQTVDTYPGGLTTLQRVLSELSMADKCVCDKQTGHMGWTLCAEDEAKRRLENP